MISKRVMGSAATLCCLLLSVIAFVLPYNAIAAEEIISIRNTSAAKDAPVFPHIKNWIKEDLHGATFLARRGECTTACHGPDLKGGSSGIACNDCHMISPHAGTWTSIGEHGVFMKEKGQRAQILCKICHGEKSKAGDMAGPRCTSCHPNSPININQ